MFNYTSSGWNLLILYSSESFKPYTKAVPMNMCKGDYCLWKLFLLLKSICGSEYYTVECFAYWTFDSAELIIILITKLIRSSFCSLYWSYVNCHDSSLILSMWYVIILCKYVIYIRI